MFKKILIANNGTEGTFKALAEALRLAHAHEFEAHMIYVEENLASGSQEGRRDETLDRKFAALVVKADAEAKRHSVKLTSHLVLGRPAPAIVDFLKSRGGFDLLVVGFKGHSALYHRILGKTVDRLIELAPCAVLVVK